MQSTITIDGHDYPYDGLTDDRRGIIAGGHIHWMFPGVRYEGGSIEPLPPIGPRKIHRVTTEVPDLTGQHPEAVKEIFEKRHAYHATLTYEQYIKTYPKDAAISLEQFEEARQRIMAETLEEFTSTRRAKKYVWDKRGTVELAERVGLLSLSECCILCARFKELRFGEEGAWAQLARLQWVAIYDDPAKTRIYLYDLIQEPDPKVAELELKRREIEADEKLAATVAAMVQANQEQAEIAERVDQLAKGQERIASSQEAIMSSIGELKTDVGVVKNGQVGNQRVLQATADNIEQTKELAAGAKDAALLAAEGAGAAKDAVNTASEVVAAKLEATHIVVTGLDAKLAKTSQEASANTEGQASEDAQKLAKLGAVIESGLLLAPLKGTPLAKLSRDERRLFNFLVAKTEDGRTLSYDLIARDFYNKSREDIRRRKKSLEQAHPEVRGLLACYRSRGKKGDAQPPDWMPKYIPKGQKMSKPDVVTDDDSDEGGQSIPPRMAIKRTE